MPSLPKSFILYGTSACHLCEQAKAIFVDVVPPHIGVLEEIDISTSDALMERYGVRIPVLAISVREEQRELNWPFDAVALGEFVDAAIDAC